MKLFRPRRSYHGFIAPSPAPYPDLTIQASQEQGRKPTPAFEPTLGSSLATRLSRKETVGHLLKISTPDVLTLGVTGTGASNFVFTFFQCWPIDLSSHSFLGSVIGRYYDPLVPLANFGNVLTPAVVGVTETFWVWVDIKCLAGTTPADYSLTITTGSGKPTIPVSVHVWNYTMPDYPSRPLMIEYSTFSGIIGHYGGYDSAEGAVGRKYIQMMKDHRITSYKSRIADPPILGNGQLDFDTYLGADSYARMILDFIPAGELVWFPVQSGNGTTTSDAYLTACETTINARGLNAWAYVIDEPDFNSSGVKNGLLTLLSRMQTRCPSLKTMVTCEYDSQVATNLDIFAPIIDFINQSGRQPASAYSGKDLWLYTSCIAHGCGPDVGSSEGSPDLVIDRDAVHSRAWPWVAQKYDAQASLYYNTTEAYSRYSTGNSPRVDPWNDVYLFTGNGDGTIMYPGRPGQRGFTSHEPVASIRMKLLRQGQFDLEYLIASGQKQTYIDSVVTHGKSFNQSYSAYEAIRTAIGNAIG